MSYWANNPELYDEIIFKQMIREGFATEEDGNDLENVVGFFLKNNPKAYKVALRAEQDYWGGMVDYVYEQRR